MCALCQRSVQMYGVPKRGWPPLASQVILERFALYLSNEIDKYGKILFNHREYIPIILLWEIFQNY